MTKLLFKESTLTNSVIRSLDNSADFLDVALREIYSMSIPGGFGQSSNLNSCVQDIKKIRNEILDLKKWTSESCKKFDNSLQNMDSVAVLLPKSKISLRKEVVR